MAAQFCHALGQDRVVGSGQPTFTGGYDFYRMEAENRDIAVPTVTHWLALVAASDRMAGIL